MERRSSQGKLGYEKREGGPSVIEGYAAVYYQPDMSGTEFELFSGAVERIAPGAFDRALAEGQDVRGLFNHDTALVLGRSTAGTLRLRADDVGLRYEIDIPDTQLGRDLAESIRRGDISGSSFAFQVKQQEWRETEGGPDVRTILDVDLFDVGPVTFPAYEGASTGTRSSGAVSEAEQSHAEWKATKQAKRDALQKRARAVVVQLDSETDIV
jgi:HK97 family phage prohead protease